MLYQIVNYNPTNKIAGGILASMAHHTTSSGMIVSLISEKPLEIGRTYSFVPKDRFFNGFFVRGELDYSDPGII